ncbi:MerR family transcriptional regulator [Candidatus Leptofilum sp.]|uniref:MerR family transcriptional regulator n=1 Tax=Candidatus Leptofilum sp. TaxID=3241576 RepID=UPI003B59D83A
MLKIGEFAKQAQITAKTLRHYEKLNLLKPTWIDRFTGYRYYSREQFSRLNRIVVLKDFGFTLEQIGQVLQEDLSVDELRGMLRLKHAELAQHIHEEQARLARIEDRLIRIEQADDFLLALISQQKEQLEMEAEIVTLPAFTAVGLMYFGKNENQEIPQVWGKLNARIGEIANKNGIAYGVCGEMHEDGRFKYMAGYDVSEVTSLPDGMERWDVPEQKYAVFSCTLKTIGQTYQYIFDTWFAKSGYEKADGPDLEYYGDEFDLKTGEGMAIYMPVK